MIPEFFNHILNYESLSVVGMAKNVGKTVCLRALLNHYAAPDKASQIAVTSIGMDGESTDSLLKTAKPELNFYPGMWVQTSERHYALRRLTAEIVDISRENTACGRLVTARVLTPENSSFLASRIHKDFGNTSRRCMLWACARPL